MAVDISDPSIFAAYSEIVSGAQTDWLLLGYGQTNHKLSLYESGSQGAEEMREYLGDDVLFGFIRVEGRFCLVAYMPETVSGVKRARALVHSRAVGNLFKAHQAVLNASKRDDVDDESVRSKLSLSESTPSSTRTSPIATANNPILHGKSATYTEGMPPTPPLSAPRLSQASSHSASPRPSGVSASAFVPTSTATQQQRNSVESRASASQQYQQQYQQARTLPSMPSPQTHSQAILTSSQFGLGPIARSDAGSSSSPTSSPIVGAPRLGPLGQQPNYAEDAPPPPPPKPAYGALEVQNAVPGRMRAASSNGAGLRPSVAEQDDPSLRQANRQGNVSDTYGPIRQRPSDDGDTPPRQDTPRTASQMQAAQSRAKWEAEARAASTPDQSPDLNERASRDSAARAEADRARQEREKQERSRMDERERRRAVLEEAQRAEAAQRLRLEEARRAEENRRRAEEAERQAFAERLRKEAAMERQRRQEEDERRKRQEEETKRLQLEQWKATRAAMEDKFRMLQGAGKVMLTGWASHQVGVIWRRRYFELRPESLLLYKNAEEVTRPLSIITIGTIRNIADARDELQLPNSLKIQFTDQEPAYFYCDSSQDREMFVAGLRQAANL